jgi:anti-sigma regulatory factor (Ser/Thr protein kinase)
MAAERMSLRADDPAAISEARHDLADRLASWHCGNIDDGLLVFSELVTNAVRHAGGATSIVVVHGDETLRFEVHDRAHAVPERREAHTGDGGFGLQIVGQLCEAWGWDQTATGKMVWSVMKCSSDSEG